MFAVCRKRESISVMNKKQKNWKCKQNGSYLAEMDISKGIHRNSPVSVARGSTRSSESLSFTFKSNAGSSLTSGILYDTSAWTESEVSTFYFKPKNNLANIVVFCLLFCGTRYLLWFKFNRCIKQSLVNSPKEKGSLNNVSRDLYRVVAVTH